MNVRRRTRPRTPGRITVLPHAASTAACGQGTGIKEIDVGILGSLLGKREPVVQYRTVDGGHPAPFPDMTDEQLYNYEVTFNVPHRTFDQPPRPAKQPAPARQ